LSKFNTATKGEYAGQVLSGFKQSNFMTMWSILFNKTIIVSQIIRTIEMTVRNKVARLF